MAATEESAGPQAQAALADWSRAYDPAGTGLLATRLARGGRDEAQGTWLMLLPEAPVIDPEWVVALDDLLVACADAAEGEDDDLEWLHSVDREMTTAGIPLDAVAFQQLLWPMARAALGRDLGSGSADAGALLALLQRLAGVCSVVLLEAMTGGRRVRLVDRLAAEPGITPRGAYAAFCRTTLRNRWDNVLGQFPVLGRLIAVTVLQWQCNLALLLERVSSDRADLATAFGVDPEAQFVGIQWDMGDSHREGQSVAILRFTRDDRDWRVIYKPASMAMQAQFEILITALARLLHAPTLAAVRVLPRDESYGYAEFIEHRRCMSADELAEFYRNAGRLLAVLHFLVATDCHAGNLIARGPSLLLIDIETLFECSLRLPLDRDLEERPGARALADSALRVGMLPFWMMLGSRRAGLDMTALGVDTEALRYSGWESINTDHMVRTLRPVSGGFGGSLPVDSGLPDVLRSYLHEIEQGFRDVYSLARHPSGRTWLIEQAEAFRGMTHRVLVRRTRAYALVQESALTPTALASANARARELEALSRPLAMGEQSTPYWQVLAAEFHDMENLDVPFFDCPLGSRELHGGGRVMTDVIEEDGLSRSFARIRAAGATDLEWQIGVIRGAILARTATRDSGMTTDRGAPAAVAPVRRSMDSPALVGDLVRDIVESRLTDATGRPTWLAFGALPDSSSFDLRMISDGLYEGRAGIAMTLLALSGEPGLPKGLADLADSVMAPVLGSLSGADPRARFRYLRGEGLGAAGVGGLLRAIAAIAPLAGPGSEDGRRLAHTLIAEITDELVGTDTRLDFLFGAAGAAAPVARLHREDPDARTEFALRALSEHLIAHQDAHTGGWLTGISRRPLVGMSHGASGMGLALLEIGAALGDERAINAGARGLRYETSVFDEAGGNWPDLRDGKGPGASMVTWCHGAPGIALCRIRARHLLPSHPDAPRWLDELVVAADIALRAPRARIDTLCCGNLGRAVALRMIGEDLGDPALLAAADRITSEVIARAIRTGAFRLSTLAEDGRSDGYFPGLMTGRAGIALCLGTSDPGLDHIGML